MFVKFRICESNRLLNIVIMFRVMFMPVYM